MGRGDLELIGFAFLSLIWVYAAVRMAGRAIMRTLDDYTGEEATGKEGEDEPSK